MAFDRQGPTRDAMLAGLLARVKALEDRNVGVKIRGEIEPVWKFPKPPRPFRSNGDGTYSELKWNPATQQYETFANGAIVSAEEADGDCDNPVGFISRERFGQLTFFRAAGDCICCDCFPLEAFGTVKKNEPGSTYEVLDQIIAGESAADPDLWRGWLRFDLSGKASPPYYPVAACLSMKVLGTVNTIPDAVFDRIAIGPLHDNNTAPFQVPGTVGATLDATASDFNVLDDICEPFARKVGDFSVGAFNLWWFDCLRLIRPGVKVEFGVITREGRVSGDFTVEFDPDTARLCVVFSKCDQANPCG